MTPAEYRATLARLGLASRKEALAFWERIGVSRATHDRWLVTGPQPLAAALLTLMERKRVRPEAVAAD